MALQLDIQATLSSDEKSIILEETTGAYDGVTNTGGWGAPNKTIADVVANTGVVITITDPDGVDYIFDSTTTPNPNSVFPNVSSTTQTYSNTSLGLASTEKISDGVWYVNYFITFDDATTTQVTNIFLFYPAARCCVQKMLSKIDGFCSECDEAKLKDAITAKTYLDAAVQAANCAKPNQANQLLAQANFLCNKTNCNC